MTVIYSQVQLTELTEEINQTSQALAEAESLEIQLNMAAAQKMTGAQVEEYAASLGMVCGGGVTVQFQYLPRESRGSCRLRDLIEADGGNRDTWLLRRIEGEQVTAMGLADRTGPRHLDILPEELELLCGNQAVFARKWLSIPVVKAGRTYLFGGGHVSQAWCRCWLPWASGPWCTTTGRSSRTRRCSPKQRRPSAGTSPGCPNR